MVTWLHVVPHGEDFEKQHQQYLFYYHRDSKNFIVMKNETFHHPRTGAPARRYLWACTMAGVQNLEAYIHANDGDEKILQEFGFINRFMEQTDFHRMIPRDDLAIRSTKWVLARPGDCYIAYTYDYLDKIGIKGMVTGKVDLLWLDTISGETLSQHGISLKWGNAVFSKPESFGKEIALYIKYQE